MERRAAVLMGSDSDLPVAEKAIAVLRELGIAYEMHILSAHRTPARAIAFAQDARDAGIGVIIAIAGMAAHLAGFVAAHTTLPVVGVPCTGGAAGGLDALLATVQMPPGVPVATVALDGGANAAWLAAQILALGNATLANKIEAARATMTERIEKKDADLQGNF